MLLSRMKVTRTAACAVLGACLISSFTLPALAEDPNFVRSRYETVQMMSRDLPMASGSTLETDVDDVDIWVKPGKSGNAHVDVFVAGRDLERAREYYEDLDFRVEKSGTTLTIECRDPVRHSIFSWRGRRHIQVWAIVTVPEELDANIRTADGDMQIDRLRGDIRIRTSDGDVQLGELGGTIEIESSDGDIRADVIEATRLRVDTEDGDVRFGVIKADNVSMASSDGDIVINNVVGSDVSVDTSDGDVEIEVKAKDLSVTCSDGDMDVDILGEMTVNLRSHDGDIRLNIPRSVGAELDLRGEDVSVRGGSDIKGKFSERMIVATLNNGGPLVRAKTRDGSIALHIREDK